MPLFKNSFAKQIIAFLVTATLPLLSLAIDFNQPQSLDSQVNVDSNINLKNMYEKDKGEEIDFTKARHWYEKVADQGNTNAEANLGAMYYLEQDFTIDQI